MVVTNLRIGQSAKVKKILLNDKTKNRFFDLGLTEGVKITLVRYAPLRDPLEIFVRGFYLAIRRRDADKILVEIDFE